MVEKHYGHLSESFVANEIRKRAPRFGIKPSRKVLAILDARHICLSFIVKHLSDGILDNLAAPC